MMTLVMMMVMTVTTNAMSYNAAKHEALFLSDKMAYELNLTAAQTTNSILIQIPCQFENDGTTPFIIGQIPDAFAKNGIYYRSDFILSAPNGIKVNHNIQLGVLR